MGKHLSRYKDQQRIPDTHTQFAQKHINNEQN